MRTLSTVVALLLLGLPALAQPGRLAIRADQPGPKISPMLYGLMTEEINHSYDGGLYAELISNRAFRDDAARPAHWSLVTAGTARGSIALDPTEPVNATALPTSLRLEVDAVEAGQRVGVANDGYWGIPVRPNTTYQLAFWAKADAAFAGPLTATIETSDGATVWATAAVPALGATWQRYQLALTTAAAATPSTTNRLVLSAGHAGKVWLSLVSLFPPTYKDRANGNRIDLMEKMAAMQPAFLRLPGGNYLEGNTIAERFAWKTTIGGLDQRPGHRGPWGYRSSDGMGLLEFLEWCEDLRMEPVLAVFAGYALRGEHVEPGPLLTPFVQEALDEIEYVTGGPGTTWGQRRAKDGHPAPFPLQYVEIGNEDWFDRSGSYDGRFAQFYDAIRAKYPQLKLIATAGVRSRTPDVQDDHYYRSARAMARDAHHYDRTPRNGPKIYVGEWASTEGSPTPTLWAALGDAAWLTGLERNSDVVVMSCYAPLLVNVNRGAAQWGTNLIGYDALTSFGSPSYHAQCLFAQNRGDTVLPVELTEPAVPAAALPAPQGGIGVGTWMTQAEYRDLKVTSGEKVLYQSDAATSLRGWRLARGTWKAQDGVLSQSDTLENCRATTGDPAWTDYTFSLKARKVSGAEGFLVMFHTLDQRNWAWWNLGGWGNTRSALEASHDGGSEPLGASAPVTIETGRWYDIRIELHGANIRCFLDGKLITEATDTPAPGPTLFATASRVDATGEVIVKVVNMASVPRTMALELGGVTQVEPSATAWIVSGQPGDVNSVETPDKVAPREVKITDAAGKFSYDFPAWSVCVLRLRAR